MFRPLRFAMAFWFPFLNFAGFFSLLLYNLIRKCSPNIFGESAFWSRVKLRFPLGSQHIIGYMLLQHVAVADHSLCTGRATCCATRFSENCFVCTGVFVYATEFCCRNDSHKFKFIWFCGTCDHVAERDRGTGFSVLAAREMKRERGLWLSFLVLCSETARKRLLRRLSAFRP